MLHSTWLLAALFVLSVLPTTAFALVLAVAGSFLWVAGVADLFLGNVRFRVDELGLYLLWVTAPLGLVGLWCLWRVFWLVFRAKAIQTPGRFALGLFAGLLAGVHLLFLKVGLLAIALPAAIFALLHLRLAYRRHALSSAA
ncbi:MAG: hypothetical protein KIT60_12195 [Burkholderiaceae bacterium]|nr:hypothetical protein [Burkholderiaceae bacterium]